ncbi:MAG: hypothetical protein CL565_05955 [Alphaproteobacteria bacterium]|nr:hypothetical protein [Alphaproteobacteria bacterium]|tara:strand:- start:109 stop:627 length:519 start_codon:yes stop_codon:yes gene_type:complete
MAVSSFQKATIAGLLAGAGVLGGCASTPKVFNEASCQTTQGTKHVSWDFSCLEVNRAMALVDQALSDDRTDPLPVGQIPRAERMMHLATGGVVRFKMQYGEEGENMARQVRNFFERKAPHLLEEYDNSVNNWEVLLQGNQCYRAQTTDGEYIVSCSDQQSFAVPDQNVTFNI